ncbi:pectinesterase PPME1 [Manihot esculenta]|uniref:pectinesterase n=1 Tax=Manihot esculenta TaxID=3983 RepID=A0A2C9UIL1_MANES|nr:pectinesterase PPME1 [Manihot esculenta]OAY30575.1 hypothetical protein MANES_14G041800v8 [Manihot esculenta]
MVKHLDFLSFAQYIFFAIILAAIPARSDDETPIPDTPDGVKTWFDANVKPLADRAGTLEKALEAAEAKPKTIKVRADGSGEFKTITDAVKSIPAKNTQRIIVDIGPGTYTEKVIIEEDKPFITFLGPEGGERPTLAFGDTAAKTVAPYTATLEVDSDFFVASNLIIQNTAPRPKGERKPAQAAVAFRIGGNMGAFYNVKMIGFLNTLCDDKGSHFFKDCFIEGTYDFIFGNGKSIYLQTEINVLADVPKELNVITAQARESEDQDVGFSIVHCKVGGKGSGAYLGEPLRPMPKVVFAYCAMSDVVNVKGWINNNFVPKAEGDFFFGEYKNTGPGADPAGRVKFAKQLTEEEVKPFLNLGYIKGTSWLLPPPKV